MKQKKVIILSSIILFIIFLVSIILSIIITNYNTKLKNKALYVVIYQYHTSSEYQNTAPKIIFKEDFTPSLTYDKTIYALDNTSYYNHVVIENGKINVIDANCHEQICVHTIIDLNNKNLNVFYPNTTTIECLPHGLKITLEEK